MQIARGPRVVSPPISSQPSSSARASRPRANGARNASSALGNARASVKASGLAPQAARSLRLTASALWPSRSGAAVDRKCRPSISMSDEIASVVPGVGCKSAQSSPTPSVARRTGRVKKRSMSSNSPRAGMVAADYRRRPARPSADRGNIPFARGPQVCNDGRRPFSEASASRPSQRTMSNSEQKAAELRRAALDYHEFPTPGKVAIAATKQLVNQHDLALAYSPGVAAACEEIVADPANAFRYTSRGNLVAVITNGTAVLGLGDIGPLAAKPVMEGKGVLFKKFAGIDVFDIEVNQKDLDKLIELIAALEPTFGGINLEDIKAPDCFYVERALRSRMKIPVFHDDQHGTAIVVGAGVLNALTVSGKKIDEIKLVTSGAGAAALACLGLLVKLGVPRENIWVTDLAGVVYEGRVELMDEDKIVYAQKTEHRTLAQVMKGADIFLGLSAAGVLKPDMVATMRAQPIIFALANPSPEILPEEVHAVRNDAIVATGRTDYPNPINNVLCFPYIFRGALDSGATTITVEMEIAAVHAIADLAQAVQSEVVTAAYAGATSSFGPEYLIPKPFDPRLMMRIAPAVAGAAAESGVAARPIADMDAYREKLQTFVYASGTTMRPIFSLAKMAAKKRVAFAEG